MKSASKLYRPPEGEKGRDRKTERKEGLTDLDEVLLKGSLVKEE